MRIEELLKTVLAATPAKRRELERVINGETTATPTDKGAEDRRLVTIAGSARLLAIGRNTIYKLIATGRLDTVELNGCKRVTMRSIREFADGARPANEKTAKLVAASQARYATRRAANDSEEIGRASCRERVSVVV